MPVSVIQPGARLHYGMPQILARHGLLRTLHTDIHASRPWAALLRKAVPKPWQPPVLQRLLGRQIPAGLPVDQIADRPGWSLAVGVAEALRLPWPRTRDVTVRMLRDLEHTAFAPGDIVYTVLVNEDVAAMRRLKDRGVRIVHECILGPDAGLLLAAEDARFPGLEPVAPLADVHEERARDREKFALCDLILVPSEFTRTAVADLAPADARIATLPYGLDLAPFEAMRTDPLPGRVLTVGTVGLRKGHPDLAAAARLLAGEPDITFRVVGPVSETLIAHPLMRGPHYVGQVPRARVRDEFARADVFAFPTICDSFGLVLVEALAMGVPVVTTPNCGDVVRDGVEGFVVPPRDPEAMAQAVSRIVRDRDLRARFSQAARLRAQDFSLERYGERLVAALQAI